MLLYLSTNTRPDIAFAVSQVARFTRDPKKTHAAAVQIIIRYLKKTADKGTIVTPSGSLDLKCWVDADFAGLYGKDPNHDPSSSRSRTGYIITLGDVPLFWKSQLQTETCTSTMESEYAALSNAMKTLIPIRNLVDEMWKFLKLQENDEEHLPSTIQTTVFEDNNACLILATTQRLTSRTRWFHQKWHHFWECMRNPLFNLTIVKIDSANQWADYLTKGLTKDLFEHIRKLVQGW